MRMSIKAAVVTAATAVLIAPAATALAASAAITDSRNDTWVVNYDDPSGPTYTPSDVTKNVDVKKAVVKLGKRVQITGKFVDLSKRGVDFDPVYPCRLGVARR